MSAFGHYNDYLVLRRANTHAKQVLINMFFYVLRKKELLLVCVHAMFDGIAE